jgi:type II secretory ATPase GspE/PulE/Tfp pilus assembly ATPase PilB-like protein
MKILTRTGEQYEVDERLQSFIAFTDEGDLYVSKSHVFEPQVMSFVAKLDKMGVKYKRHAVDMTVIAEQYKDAPGRKGSGDDSTTQIDVKELFKLAVKKRASDIHIRVDSDKTRIFFRVHNDLEFVREDVGLYGSQLCSTIYQSMTDISDPTFRKNQRQDARISDKGCLPRELDGVRIATTPQVDGHVMVMRLLYNDASDDFSLLNIGFGARQDNIITLLRRLPTGITLISGPTGSGKSTTLQRILGQIDAEYEGRKHIITVEDPPEYPISGAIQTPVTNAETEEERAKAFQAAIKSAMRLDPDIIMVGEMRDTASSKLAIQAAMTGHQVWSTVHANSALAILDRLIDMGVEPALVYDPNIVTGLICQRLVKTLCPDCKEKLLDVKDRYTQRNMDRILSVASAESIYVQGSGCNTCKNTGTSGRTSVAEAIKTDAKLMDLFRKGEKLEAENYWRRDQEGQSVLDSTIDKVNRGEVDPFMAESVVGPLVMGQIERDDRIERREVEGAI